MTLFIDGDAFPNLLKPIVLRAIEKNSINTFLISNKKINIGDSRYITYIIVDSKIDEADNKIIELINKDDLVITADIPLADRAVKKMAFAIDHRGELYTEDNIQNFLSIRNLMETIRESGMLTKGPKAFSKNDVQNFANSFNKYLQKYN